MVTVYQDQPEALVTRDDFYRANNGGGHPTRNADTELWHAIALRLARRSRRRMRAVRRIIAQYRARIAELEAAR